MHQNEIEYEETEALCLFLFIFSRREESNVVEYASVCVLEREEKERKKRQ